jgi:hypothetical protein
MEKDGNPAINSPLSHLNPFYYPKKLVFHAVFHVGLGGHLNNQLGNSGGAFVRFSKRNV